MTEKERRWKSNAMNAVIIAIAIVTTSLFTMSWAVFVFQIVFAMVLLPVIWKLDDKLSALYVLIFVISMAFVFLVHEAYEAYYGVPYYIGGSDDLMFEEHARTLISIEMYDAGEILEKGVLGYWHNAVFFPVYIAGLMNVSEFLGGYNTYLPRLLNVYYFIGVLLILQHLLGKYGNFTKSQIFITVALLGFTPNLQFINAHVFRDTFNLFQVFLLIYLFDKLLENKYTITKIGLILMMIGLVYSTFYTRVNSLAFVVIACMLILFNKLKVFYYWAGVLGVPLFLSFGIFDVLEIEAYIDTYSSYILDLTDGGLSQYVFMHPLLPVGIFLRAAYAMITPFPNFFILFQESDKLLYDIIMLLVYVGVVIQILAIPFVLKRLMKFDWLSLTFMVFFLSVITTTFTFRHVLFYFPFFVAAAVQGFYQSSNIQKVYIMFFAGMFSTSLAMTYFVLKFYV